MKTPKEYSDNLKKGIITDQMVSDVLFSYSKRAKNYRDNARELRKRMRNRYYHYSFRFDEDEEIEKNEFRKNVLYERKSDILHYFEERFIKAIHIQEKNETVRVYDYESEYDELVDSDRAVHWNSYLDKETYEEVYFVDVLKEEQDYLYFLYYELPGRSFHTPVDKETAEEYARKYNLQTIELDELTTYGEDVGLLLSLQFCDKLYKHLFPNRTIYKISQPICYDRITESCHFYTDEELARYRAEKTEKKRLAAIEAQKRREKRKEETRLRKIKEKEHLDDLKNLIKKQKVTDWNIIHTHLWKKSKPYMITADPIFKKFYEDLKPEIRKEIKESYRQTVISKFMYPDDEMERVMEGTTDDVKKIICSAFGFVNSEKLLNFHDEWSSLISNPGDNRMNKLDAFIRTVRKYNEKVQEEQQISYFRLTDLTICFCGVPVLGNLYVPHIKQYKYLNEMISKAKVKMRNFKKMYPDAMTIGDSIKNLLNK